jgi:dipeptidyl aminopeptidase/acylaminoacyl peptidase
VWAPNGRSTLIFTSLPVADDPRNAALPPQWVEVEIETRKTTPLGIPSEWHVSNWRADGAGVILSKNAGREFAWLPRSADGRWGPLAKIDMDARFSLHWEPVTNGKVVIGITEGLYSPPEFAAFDLTTRTLRVLTNLNPKLRQRQYASVEKFRWKHRYDPEASGFLVKPMDFIAGKRYPLVILLDDGTLNKVNEPYVLDAVDQLNGHAVQMLAAAGFVVLYTREPRDVFVDVPGLHKEGERMREHIESAISHLEQAELIDPSRVGLSGWSRAAYHTNYILIHASCRFAAATQMDGGAREYSPRRPLTDEELQRVRTPLLLEPHGLDSLVEMTAMADRLEAFGKPVEVLYYQSAPHETIQPQHRLRSLETHVDWWRFWLQDEEDSDPAKDKQFKYWRQLRAKWNGIESEHVSRAPSTASH